MGHTLGEIAAAIGATALGDGSLRIERVAEPDSAGPADLAMATQPKYAEALPKGRARAAMLWDGADWAALGLNGAICVHRPRVAMGGVTKLFDKGQGFQPGIHASAVVDPAAKLGRDVSVGPLTVISAGATIGDNAVIGPQCFIGAEAQLGHNAFLREAVSIGARVRIGDRFIAQPGVRLGGDGFSFVTPEKSGVEAVRETLGDQGDTEAQSWLRIHSLGSVQIGDDVELGANTTIDNGTIRDTIIGDGVKTDDQVHIGHNVIIGRDCLLCGQSGVAGSTVIGDYVVLGGQSGVGDNLTVGDRVVLGGAAKVLSNVPAGRVVMGYPAVRMDLHTEIYKATRRLPRLVQDLTALKKAVFKRHESD
jgi:UDP-3-O-[3-hydroxymyristoyl] glucosamine N-acyltransferase